ncbi:MAG TPA: hypothetical protein VD788_13035 [Candidatus Polarisedimenticolaceae bacterium]|nr:hypothetical protein [Candidatus Polarisedimenticolaceae bacterium]
MASYPEVVPPGQVGNIDAQIDTLKLTGEVGRGVTVYSNDPTRPTVFLTVHAVVVGGVVVLPEERLVLTNATEAGSKRALVVRRGVDEDGELTIGDVQLDVPWLDVVVEELAEPRNMRDGAPSADAGDWVVSVSLGRAAPVGRHEANLTFGTGLERQPVVSVPIVARKMAPVMLSEERLVLPRSAGEPVARGTFLLTVRRGLDPDALEVTSSPGELTTDLERSGDRGYKLHLAWASSDPPAGEVTFRVGAEELRVPVAAR